MHRSSPAPRLVLGAGLALGLAAKSGTASADDRFTLAWDAPSGCPSRAIVERTVRAWMEPDRGGQASPTVRVEAAVRPADGGWELDLSLASPGGSEHQLLRASRCETFVEVVALKVALAADPAAILRSLATALPPSPEPLAPRFAVRGALGAGIGPLPDISAFAAVAGSLEWPGWRLEAGVTGWLPRPAAYPDLPNVGANFTLVTGGARGCLVPAMGKVDFPLCAGVEVGALQGTGFGATRDEASTELWTAGVAGPAARIPLGGSTSLWIGADAVVGVVRPSFFVRNLDQLYRPDPVAARTWAGFELRL